MQIYGTGNPVGLTGIVLYIEIKVIHIDAKGGTGGKFEPGSQGIEHSAFGELGRRGSD
jgi:hypothetical protein